MPYTVTNPENNAGKLSALKSLGITYDYDYPEGLDLRPGSKLHNRIVSEVSQRARDSHSFMQKRFPSWQHTDKVLTSFVKLSEEEERTKAKDARKPMSVVVPYSYAMLETLLTYVVAALLNDPIFSYSGRGPEDTAKAILLQELINQQTHRSKTALQLHTMFRDMLAYGIGPAVPCWEKRLGKRVIRTPDPFGSGYSTSFDETVIYEGNYLKNVDPYCYLPDPSCSVHEIQKGEFVGWVERNNLMNILSAEETDENVFNARYLNHISGESSLFQTDHSEREKRFGGKTKVTSSSKNYVDEVFMYIKLIPKDWELGTSEYPEKWLFAVAGDCLVTQARPLGLAHDMFPVTCAAPDFDGYSASPISRVEIISGLQETLDWLFSSHIANVRKAINDMLIVDPYLVNMEDLENPEPGKLVRMRRAAWGKGVENAVKQLRVDDITRNHIGDSSYIMDIMQRATAASDIMMGIQRRTSERITAAEAQGNRMSALSRLERITKVTSMQAIYDISYLFASHTQQLMSQETYISIVGDHPKELIERFQMQDNRLMVGPSDISIDYDIILKDGTVPNGQYLDAWTEVFRIVAAQPELGAQFDTVRIFKHLATSMGAKDVNSFVRSGAGQVVPQVMPDEQVMREVERGNIVPTGGY